MTELQVGTQQVGLDDLLTVIMNLAPVLDKSEHSPHEFVHDLLHPQVYTDGIQAVAPQHTQEVHNEPVALLEDQLFTIKEGQLRGNFRTCRQT